MERQIEERMTPQGFYAGEISTRIREIYRWLSDSLIDPPRREGISYLDFFEYPHPSVPDQTLLMTDRDDAVEIQWRFPHTRGPAEYHWIEDKEMDPELIRRVLNLLEDIFRGLIVVRFQRRRTITFGKYISASFVRRDEIREGDEIAEWRVAKC
ncbi:MAG: hypothetical protein AAF591_00535 [Verrucomicrobiota bacterium]